MSQSANNLIWVDLEMTGLDTVTDLIIEIATIITDVNLDVIEEGPSIAIRTPETALEGMDDWNVEHHSRSGLLDRVRSSSYSLSDAETATLEFIRKYVPEHQSPMCGNSICQDRRFLARLMPDLEAYFHYRNLDVTTVKILVNRWAPGKPQFDKEVKHRALEDVRDSIAELKFYRLNYLNL